MKTRDIAYLSLFVALNILFELIDKILPFRLPQGGSLSLSIIPIILASYVLGPKKGALCGLAASLLQLFLGLAFVYTPFQYLLEYPLIYLILGIISAFHSVLIGLLFANVSRYLIHVIAGVLFFGEFAKGSNIWLYSLSYNLIYILPSALFTSIFTLIILKNKKFQSLQSKRINP